MRRWPGEFFFRNCVSLPRVKEPHCRRRRLVLAYAPILRCLTVIRLFSFPLVRHLIAVLLIKAAALSILWHQFVAPQKKSIDANAMAVRILPSPFSQSSMEDADDDRFHCH